MQIGVQGLIHRNDGRHLHSGVEKDTAGCALYNRLAGYPHPLYSPSEGKVGWDFIEAQANLWKQCRLGKCNSEVPLMFSVYILCRKQGTVKLDAIRRRITNRLKD